tara:strand:+ start:150 stop:1121 length:972 start_codon:yes stop_codon:yes gene_type:complete
MARRFHNNHQSSLPTLPKDISKLDIKNLKKIKTSRDKYLTKKKDYEEELQEVKKKNKQIEALNLRNRLEFERWESEVETKKIRPLKEKISLLMNEIREREVGFIGKLLGETVEVCGIKIAAEDGPKLHQKQIEVQQFSLELERYEERKVDTAAKLQSKYVYQKRNPQPLKKTTSLIINGIRMKVDFEREDLKHIDTLLSKKTSELNSKKEAASENLNRLKARATEREEEVRSQMQKYRSYFSDQFKITRKCPYCGKHLTRSDSHMDHIYPVAKGGQSVLENLVFVCSRCNQKKGKLTLNRFISKHRLDQQLIYKRLEKLKKDF